MATIPEDEEMAGRTHVGEDARRIVESMRVAVTGSPMVSLRRPLAYALVAGLASFAPQPWAALAVGLLVFVLVTDHARH